VTTPYGDSLLHLGYSNQFWVFTDNINGIPANYSRASGNGGQIIVIDRQNKVVMVTTAGNYDQPILRKSSWDLYYDFVFPAVIRSSKNMSK
jgi:CubicO group peptidase (beta-lactamase class C family)